MNDSTPILVGAGQFTEKDVPLEQSRSPMGIAAAAAKAALVDTGLGPALAPSIDSVFAVRIFPDSTNRPRMQIPFGRATNPPRAIARRIGADPLQAVYGNVGGNTPQKMINEAARGIAAGDIEVALIAGGEAIRTAQLAIRAGVDLNWEEDDPGSLDDRGLGETLMTPHEFAHGIGVPVQTYPLFENAWRAHLGHEPEQHMKHMARLMAGLNVVAANNPYAFYGTKRSAEELATVTPENRFICYPYPKWMNAREGVNQGAALVMTSVGRARELGIDPARWVFLHGCAELNEKLLVSERVNYHSAPAIEAACSRALDMAGVSIDQISYFDLYSCFPVAIELACSALQLDCFDPRGVTLTGGLPFFGGPGNNYSLHAVASLLPLLRQHPTRYGLITANGGSLTKHAVGVYSATPVRDSWQAGNGADDQARIDAMPGPEFTETPEGPASIETYTVCFGQGTPERGIIIGRLQQDGRRFVANTAPDGATLGKLLAGEQVGRRGRVAREGELNIFTLQ